MLVFHVMTQRKQLNFQEDPGDIIGTGFRDGILTQRLAFSFPFFSFPSIQGVLVAPWTTAQQRHELRSGSECPDFRVRGGAYYCTRGVYYCMVAHTTVCATLSVRRKMFRAGWKMRD
jgi:hypothetical protein